MDGAPQHSLPAAAPPAPGLTLAQRLRERRQRSVSALQGTGFNLMLFTAPSGIGPLAEGVRLLAQYSMPLAFIGLLGFFALFGLGYGLGSGLTARLARRSYRSALPLLLSGNMLSLLLDNDYLAGVEASARTVLPSPLASQRRSALDCLSLASCYFPLIRQAVLRRPRTLLAVYQSKAARLADVPLAGCALLGICFLLLQGLQMMIHAWWRSGPLPELFRPALLSALLLSVHTAGTGFFLWSMIQRHGVMLALCDVLLWDGEYSELADPREVQRRADSMLASPED